MRELIEEMARRNIGSLCLYLKNEKNSESLRLVEESIPLDASERPLSEKVYYFVNDIKEPILCECGAHKSFIGFKTGYRSSCGRKECFISSRKKTCIEKWGVDNPKKSKEVLEKEKEAIIKKWGGEHYMKSEGVRAKFNSTMKEKWGVEWAQQSPEISGKSKKSFEENPERNKIIAERRKKLLEKSEEEKHAISKKKSNTIRENWGSLEAMREHVLEKTKEKSRANLGVEHHLSHPDIIRKRVDSYNRKITDKICKSLPVKIDYVDRQPNKNGTDNVLSLFCKECQSEFNINRQLLVFRTGSGADVCLGCNPVLSGRSGMELELLELIRESYSGEIIANSKSIIKGELDIYLPELKLAFQFNGLYWHSEDYKDRLYHLNKTKECGDAGIELIHIWEDDWVYKKEIAKSIVLNKLGKSKRIYARNCEVGIPTNAEARIFLNENHIQGFVGSKIKIGLYSEGNLVSIMTFGSLRKSLGYNKSEGSYEMLRFCSKKNTTVVGGASKLLKLLFRDYECDQIISYSDSSRSIGSLYEKLGFVLSHQTEPNYYYIVDGIRKHRFNFRKDRLVSNGADSSKTEVEIMRDMGYNRIFDCGSKKWIFKRSES